MKLKHLYLSLEGRTPYYDGMGVLPKVGDEIQGFKVAVVEQQPYNPEQYLVIFTPPTTSHVSPA